jgi:hypothetical protein
MGIRGRLVGISIALSGCAHPGSPTFAPRPATPVAAAVAHEADVGHEGGANPAHDAHGASRPPLRADLSHGWCDPWEHVHASACGTPYVHAFAVEPAFLGRDLLLNVRLARGEDATEVETEAELEWAFTRRLGVAFEVPFHVAASDGDVADAGVGDISVAPRSLLLEFPRFLLSADLAATLPTGDATRGFGGGEVVLEPGLAAWVDLGRGFTASLRGGSAFALDSGERAWSWGTGLAWSFEGPALCGCRTHGGHAHPSLRPGLTTLHLEAAGEEPQSGSGEQGFAEVLLGASWRATDQVEVRAAVSRPVRGDAEEDAALTLGFVLHL